MCQLMQADIILPVVYTEASRMASCSSVGWASEALLEGGVPVRECWEAVMGLHDPVSCAVLYSIVLILLGGGG